jgi:hypothetical protein
MPVSIVYAPDLLGALAALRPGTVVRVGASDPG